MLLNLNQVSSKSKSIMKKASCKLQTIKMLVKVNKMTLPAVTKKEMKRIL